MISGAILILAGAVCWAGGTLGGRAPGEREWIPVALLGFVGVVQWIFGVCEDGKTERPEHPV
jgi:drug/metabolite transporter (DMT)-like permease